MPASIQKMKRKIQDYSQEVKSMSSKIKKIISGLMCMALLAVYAVPVNAAQYMEDMGVETASACKHVHTNR